MILIAGSPRLPNYIPFGLWNFKRGRDAGCGRSGGDGGAQHENIVPGPRSLTEHGLGLGTLLLCIYYMKVVEGAIYFFPCTTCTVCS